MRDRESKGFALFRFASGRQKILDEMCTIIKKKPRGRQHVPEDEKELVMSLYRAGLKPGEIVERLWREHGLARKTAMIDTLIHREEKKSAENK